MIAALEVGGKIDVGAEHGHDLRSHAVRDVGSIGRREQRGANHAGMHLDASFDSGCFFSDSKFIAVALDHQVPGSIVTAVDNRRAQHLQHTIIAGLRLHRGTVLESQHGPCAAVGFDEIAGFIIVHAKPGQQSCQRVAGAHFVLGNIKLLLSFEFCDLLAKAGQFQFCGNSLNRYLVGIR